MTRGNRPLVAIREAQKEAMKRGCQVITVHSSSTNLPFDFLISDQGRISLVRVRRLRYPRFEIPDIAHFCRDEIEALRSLHLPEEISRQLHVRGPGRQWHRYLILPDGVRKLEEGAITKSQGTSSEEGTTPSPIVPNRSDLSEVRPIIKIVDHSDQHI